MFLILRCTAANILEQVGKLQNNCEFLGIRKDDVRCPSHVVIKRVGRERARVEVEVPLLGSFLFVRWGGSIYWANYIEQQYHHLTVMRLPQGGYATCTEAEVDAIGEEIPEVVPVIDLNLPAPVFPIGEPVEVTRGFLKGVTGKVLRNKPTGEVVLRVVDNKGWKLSTLLIHNSVLRSQRATI